MIVLPIFYLIYILYDILSNENRINFKYEELPMGYKNIIQIKCWHQRVEWENQQSPAPNCLEVV